MRQIIGLLSIIALMALGNTVVLGQGQPAWVLEKKAKKEAYKTEQRTSKDYFKYMTKEEIEAFKANRKKRIEQYRRDRMNGRQAKDVRNIRQKPKYQGAGRGEYKGQRRGRCGNGDWQNRNRGNNRTTTEGRRIPRTNPNPDGSVITNRRGNSTSPTTTKPTTNEKVKVVTKPTTTTTPPSTSTKPRVVVRPQQPSTPTESKPANGGLKGRRSAN